MIVPNMSRAELVRELISEVPYLMRKLKMEMERIYKHKRKYKISKYSGIHEFKSPGKNLWYLNICSLQGQESVALYTRFNLHKRFAVIQFDVLNNMCVLAASHFFSRYHERAGLGPMKPVDVVHHYFNHNTDRVFHRETTELDQPMRRIYLRTQLGFAPGVEFPDLKLYELRTFLTEDMLNRSQMSIRDYMRHLHHDRTWDPMLVKADAQAITRAVPDDGNEITRQYMYDRAGIFDFDTWAAKYLPPGWRPPRDEMSD